MNSKNQEVPQVFSIKEKGNTRISRKEFITSTLKAGVLAIVSPGIISSCKEEGAYEKDIIKSLKYDYIQHTGFGLDAFSINKLGNKLTTFGRNEIKHWSLPDGIPLDSEQVEFQTIFLSPDKSLMITSSEEDEIQVWQMPDRTLINQWSAESRMIRTMCLSPDYKVLVTAGYDKSAKLWDINTGELLHTFYTGRGIASVCFSPDGKFLATGGGDLNIWNLTTNEVHKSFFGNYADVCFSNDGKFLAAGSILRSFPDFKFVKYIHPDENQIYCLEFSPNSKWLICGIGISKTIDGINKKIGSFIIHSMDDMEVKYFDGFDSYISKATFSSDNSLLATANGNGIVNLWTMPDIEAIYTKEYCLCDSICSCNSIRVCACNSECSCDSVCSYNFVCSCYTICPSDSICECHFN